MACCCAVQANRPFLRQGLQDCLFYVDTFGAIGKNVVVALGPEEKVSETGTAGAAYEPGEVTKSSPMSHGKKSEQRKRKPHILAVINEACTGCSGSPACVDYCPVEECMYWVPDAEHPPFGRIEVDPFLCIGCKLCTSKGPDGAFLEGCPWDAIDMVPLGEWEGRFGTLPY